MRNATVIAHALFVVSLVSCTSSPETKPAAAAFELQAFASRFEPGAMVGAPRLVDCTLSEGHTTTCVSVTLPANPATFEMGPWCPAHIADGADRGGIWPHDGRMHDVDGLFIKNLPTFYNDSTWQLYDPQTGVVNVTDTPEACAAAARPDVDPRYHNYCVQCLASYITSGLTNTYVIPTQPVAASRVAPRVGHDGVGIAYRGVRLDAPAPVDDILSAHTLAPFDDCGGHVNPAVGYHIHAVTNCIQKDTAETGHGTAIGVALDGYALHSRLDAGSPLAVDVDACGGHTTGVEGYHYHVGDAGSNAILGCHKGQVGCVLDDPNASCDASALQRPNGPPGRRPQDEPAPNIRP
ncbi:MAG: YHYH protein [Gemmatimonadaceae bacterium]|nr:YHYH protein [Gemmatimonadaceae bacterium]